MPGCLGLISFGALFPLTAVSGHNPKIWWDNIAASLKPTAGSDVGGTKSPWNAMYLWLQSSSVRTGSLTPAAHFDRHYWFFFLTLWLRAPRGIPLGQLMKGLSALISIFPFQQRRLMEQLWHKTCHKVQWAWICQVRSIRLTGNVPVTKHLKNR